MSEDQVSLMVKQVRKPWTSRFTFQLPGIITSLLLIAVVIINILVQPTFFTLYSFTSNFATFVPLIFAAIAQAIIVISGGLDLSIGAQVALISVIALRVMDGQDSRILLGLVAAILAGLACGAVNGFVVAIIRLQPLIATFATASVFGGLALFVLPSPGGLVPPAMTTGYRMAVAGVPVPVLIVVLGALLWWVASKTVFVRHLYAVGGDREAAFASLVPVTRVIFGSFMLSSVFVSFAAFAVLANTGSGDPLIGANMALDSIAAVVLGGIALSGGRGNPMGAIAGALILAISTNILAFMRVATTYRALAAGLIIIAALALSVLTTSRGGKK